MYISATQALVRTQNARKSDGYVGEYEIYPAMMSHIMDLITEATLAGNDCGSASLMTFPSLYLRTKIKYLVFKV